MDAFIVAGLAALLLITFVVRTFYIPSGSMVPTLQIHDVLLVDELEYRLRSPNAGEVAVFTPPIDAQGNAFVKRVIGQPGDTISISGGIVNRNGQPLSETYESEPPTYDLQIKNYSIYVNYGSGFRALNPRFANIPPKRLWQQPDRIPAGFFFMLGDNRNQSDDSHVWGFAQTHGRFSAGPLANRNVQAQFAGRVFLVFWPLARLHVLHA